MLRLEYDFRKNIVTLVTSDNKRWKYKRQGIPESTVMELAADKGIKSAINILVDEGKLIPEYGGKITIK